MPKKSKQNKYGKLQSLCSNEEEKNITKRLMVISLQVDKFVYQDKRISTSDAKKYINEILSYKPKCIHDKRKLQVIEKLLRCMKSIMEQQENAEGCNTNITHASNDNLEKGRDSVSPVYSVPDIDRQFTRAFVDVENASNINSDCNQFVELHENNIIEKPILLVDDVYMQKAISKLSIRDAETFLPTLTISAKNYIADVKVTDFYENNNSVRKPIPLNNNVGDIETLHPTLTISDNIYNIFVNGTTEIENNNNVETPLTLYDELDMYKAICHSHKRDTETLHPTLTISDNNCHQNVHTNFEPINYQTIPHKLSNDILKPLETTDSKHIIEREERNVESDINIQLKMESKSVEESLQKILHFKNPLTTIETQSPTQKYVPISVNDYSQYMLCDFDNYNAIHSSKVLENNNLVTNVKDRNDNKNLILHSPSILMNGTCNNANNKKSYRQDCGDRKQIPTPVRSNNCNENSSNIKDATSKTENVDPTNYTEIIDNSVCKTNKIIEREHNEVINSSDICSQSILNNFHPTHMVFNLSYNNKKCYDDFNRIDQIKNVNSSQPNGWRHFAQPYIASTVNVNLPHGCNAANISKDIILNSDIAKNSVIFEQIHTNNNLSQIKPNAIRTKSNQNILVVKNVLAKSNNLTLIVKKNKDYNSSKKVCTPRKRKNKNVNLNPNNPKTKDNLINKSKAKRNSDTKSDDKPKRKRRTKTDKELLNQIEKQITFKAFKPVFDHGDKEIDSKAINTIDNKTISETYSTGDNDLSWIEHIRCVREISKDEYDTIFHESDDFWNNVFLPSNWDDKDFTI